MQSAIAIIGMGARFPGSPDLPAFRRTVTNGTVHVRPVPAQRWDHAVIHSLDPRRPNKTPAKAGAFMDDVDAFAPEFFGISPKRARIMDPQQRLMLEVSRHALEDAGYGTRKLGGGNVGVYVGASSSDHRTLATSPVSLACDLAGRSGQAPRLTDAEVTAIWRALPPLQAYSIIGQQLNMIAANVSQVFDFKGPSLSIDTACSSALAALHEAVLHLRCRIVDAALVGGVYVQIDPTMMVSFSKIGALSPTDSCRPFGAEADGFVLGEGIGVVALKRLEDAERDNDRVVAVIRGVGMNNDGRSAGPATPDAAGQSAALRIAWEDAGADPASVGYIEAHATGTTVGDGVELSSLSHFFAGVPGCLPLSAVKANIGHGISSAGIASLIKAALCVNEGIIPPQPLAGSLRQEFSGPDARFRLPKTAEPWAARDGAPRLAGVSAFGFGGTNLHVVLEEAKPRRLRARAPRESHRLRFSAPTLELLSDYLKSSEDAVRDSRPTAENVAHTLALRRSDTLEASFMVDSTDSLAEALAAARVTLEAGGTLHAADSDAADEGTLALLPPSPLPVRRFWVIDSTKTRSSGAGDQGIGDPDGAAPAVRAAGLVTDAIMAVTAWRTEEILPRSRFIADLGFDSLATLELMTVLGRSLPGIAPPPRAIFTTELTVGALTDYLTRSVPLLPGAAVGHIERFDTSRDPWLKAHRPAGHALLPLAGLLVAARRALSARIGGSFAITSFELMGPVAIGSDAIELTVEIAPDNSFVIRELPGRAPLARGTVRTGEAALPELSAGAMKPGGLRLDAFYAEFAFHGPALRALSELPQVGPLGALGHIPAGRDEVVVLDGALQLALYWLASSRQQSAVATGFDEYRQTAPWPTSGGFECLATLAEASGDRFVGHFDLRDKSGTLVAQWRGVRAQTLRVGLPDMASGPEAWPEVRALAAQKESLSAAGHSMPYFRVVEGNGLAQVSIGDREFVNFSSYNYLGLSESKAVKLAAANALERFGTSASASRVASGENPLHGELEREISRLLGCEDSLALVSGHSTNVSVIGHLLGPEDVIIHDQLAHDSIVTGARLSGARRLAFSHNDVRSLEGLLEVERPKARRLLIAVEGVYSMDGDLAPLDEIVRLKRRYDSLLLVDEAHSLGVIGATGRGAGEHFGVERTDVDLWMGTLSKALASAGGYLAGRTVLIDYLRFTMPGFLYSVGLPPSATAAALAATRELRDHPGLPARLKRNSDLFRDLCRERGIDFGASAYSAVVPCIAGSSDRALRLASALSKEGINVQPIFHPAVEEGRARLRFFITALHTEVQLRHTADALSKALDGLSTAGTAPYIEHPDR